MDIKWAQVTGPAEDPIITILDVPRTRFKTADLPGYEYAPDNIHNLIVPDTGGGPYYSYGITLCLWSRECEELITWASLHRWDGGGIEPSGTCTYYGLQQSDTYCQATGQEYVSGDELLSYHSEITSKDYWMDADQLQFEFKDGAESFTGAGRVTRYVVFQTEILSNASNWDPEVFYDCVEGILEIS